MGYSVKLFTYDNTKQRKQRLTKPIQIIPINKIDDLSRTKLNENNSEDKVDLFIIVTSHEQDLIVDEISPCPMVWPD